MAQPILRVEELQKRFKERVAVDRVSFDVYEGEIFCLLGPNGAGKTTTINILSTALRADGGTVFFRGKPVGSADVHYRASLGIVPQNLAIYEEISARDNVAFFASLYGLRGKQLRDNVQKALEFVGLSDRQQDKPSTYSGGMKRRLNIACALAHDPQIIILDEPTVGIDPQSRTHILDSIKGLRDAGATVLYTTHYMEEVEAISTRIVIMDDGRVIAEGTKEQLKERVAGGRVYSIGIEGVEAARANGVAEALFSVGGVQRVDWTDEGLDVAATPGIDNLDKIIAALMDAGLKIRNLTTAAASLETVFLQLTGRSLRD